MLAYMRSRSDRERDRRVDAGLRVLTTFAYEWARYFSTLMCVKIFITSLIDMCPFRPNLTSRMLVSIVVTSLSFEINSCARYMALGLTGVVFVVMANRDSAAYTTPQNSDQVCPDPRLTLLTWTCLPLHAIRRATHQPLITMSLSFHTPPVVFSGRRIRAVAHRRGVIQDRSGCLHRVPAELYRHILRGLGGRDARGWCSRASDERCRRKWWRRWWQTAQRVAHAVCCKRISRARSDTKSAVPVFGALGSFLLVRRGLCCVHTRNGFVVDLLFVCV